MVARPVPTSSIVAGSGTAASGRDETFGRCTRRNGCSVPKLSRRPYVTLKEAPFATVPLKKSRKSRLSVSSSANTEANAVEVLGRPLPWAKLSPSKSLDVEYPAGTNAG